MTHYEVYTQKGNTFIMVADLTEASAPIGFLNDDGEYQPSPFQTADARHRTRAAATLLVDWFASNGDEADKVVSVEDIDDEYEEPED